MVNDIQRAEFLLIGIGVGSCPNKVVLPDGVELQQVMDSASSHGLIAVVWAGVQACMSAGAKIGDICDEERVLTYIGYQVFAEEKYKQYCSSVSNLIQAYRRYNFPLLVVKGLSLTRYWPQPAYRPIGDVDVYLFGHHEEADKLLGQDYGVNITYYEVGHHTEYNWQGVHVENHSDFVTTVNGDKKRKTLAEALKAEVSRGVQKQDIDDSFFFRPSATFNAMYLVVHMAFHFKSEILTLKQMCDWMLFLKNEHDHIEWERVCDFYQQFGMMRFVCAINGILIDYWGMEPSWVPIISRNQEIEQRVLDDIFNGCVFEHDESFIRKVKANVKQYIANRWKYRLLNENALSALLRRGIHYVLHPQDFKMQCLNK